MLTRPGRHPINTPIVMNALSRLETGIDSWNEWRDRHPADPADLSEQDLSHGYFFEGNFRGINLRGANLKRACLIGADLRQADLTNADLTGAYLGDANLYGANLSNVDLTDANLDRADLRRTNLLGARIVGADIRTARLPDPDEDPYMDEVVELIAERRLSARSDSSYAKDKRRATEAAHRTANYRQSLLQQMIDHLPTLTRDSKQVSEMRQQAIRQSAALSTRPTRTYRAIAHPSKQKIRWPKKRQPQWGRRQTDKKFLAKINRQLAQYSTWFAAGLLMAISLPMGFARVNAPPLTAQAVSSFALAKSLTGSSQVWAVATHSSDTKGSLVIGGGDNGEIEIWNGQTGEFVRRIKGHKGAVRALAMSSSGDWLVSGGKDGVKVWQPKTGQLKYTLPETQASVRAVAISPDETTFISSDRSGNIIAWQLSTGEQIYQIETHAPVWSVAIAPDGQSFVTGSGIGGSSAQLNHPLKQWNLASGQLIQTFAGHRKAVRSVAISPDGQTLASGSTDETIKLWDLASGSLKTTLEGHQNGILSLAISPDGQTLASSGTDHTLKLWDLPSQKLTETLENSSIITLAFDPAQQTLVSGGQDQRVKVWQ